MTATGHLYGAGIYSEVFCIGSNNYNIGTAASATITTIASLPSNCNIGTGGNLNTGATYSLAISQPARSVNAIEIVWTMPYAVPCD